MNNQFERTVREAGETGGRFKEDYYNTSLINDSLSLEMVEDRITERMDVQECLDSFNNHSPHKAELYNPSYSFTHTESRTILRVKDPYSVTIANTTENAQPMQLELRIRLEKLVNRTNILIKDLNDGYISRVETDRIDIHVTQQDDYLLWLLIDGDYRFRFVTGTM